MSVSVSGLIASLWIPDDSVTHERGLWSVSRSMNRMGVEAVCSSWYCSAPNTGTSIASIASVKSRSRKSPIIVSVD